MELRAWRPVGQLIANRYRNRYHASAETVVNSKVPYSCGGGGIGRRTSLRC